MNMLRLRQAALMIVLFAALRPGVARADDVDQLYEQGQAAFEKQSYQEAHAKLAAVWAVRQSYDVATVLAQTEVQLGKHRDAAEHLAYAVAHFPVSAKLELRKQVEAMFADVRAKVGTVRVKVTPEAAAVTVNGRPYREGERSGAIFVEPGKATIEASAPGHRAVRRVLEVSKGTEAEATIALTQDAPNDEPSRLPSYISFGVGGAGLLVGVVTGAMTVAKTDSLAQTCGPTNVCPESARGAFDEANVLANVSNVGWVLAGAGAVAGTVLLFVPGRRNVTQAALVVGPTFVGVKGAF